MPGPDLNEQEHARRKPLFSGIAMVCLLIGAFLAWAALGRFDAGETIDGYGDLGITLSFLVALLLSGLITGQIGLVRGEKPVALPILALLLNGAIFITVIVHLPR